MKRLGFIFGIVGTMACSVAGRFKTAVSARFVAKPKSWAEHLAERGRRFEQLMHVKYCYGDYDHLSTPEQAAKRKARCAKICGLCRHLNSPQLWPSPTYRRPADSVLTALEREAYYDPLRGLGAIHDA